MIHCWEKTFLLAVGDFWPWISIEISTGFKGTTIIMNFKTFKNEHSTNISQDLHYISNLRHISKKEGKNIPLCVIFNWIQLKITHNGIFSYESQSILFLIITNFNRYRKLINWRKYDIQMEIIWSICFSFNSFYQLI